MSRCLLSIISSLFSLIIYAQPPSGTVPPAAPFSYYVAVKGVSSKKQVVELEARFSQKPGVVWCLANAFPVEYFLVKSKVAISQAELVRWLNNPSYTIEYFGEGERSREQFYLKRKQKKQN